MFKKIYRYPVVILFLLLALTVIAGFGIPRMKVVTDMGGMLPAGNKVYLEDSTINAIYGENESMFVGIRSKSGNIYTVENLAVIQTLTRQFQEIRKKNGPDNAGETINQIAMDDIDDLLSDSASSGSSQVTDINTSVLVNEVKSITNLDIIEGVDGGLVPVSMETLVPRTDEEIELFKEKLFSWDNFKGVYYSENNSSAAITVEFGDGISDPDKNYVYRQVEAIIASHPNSDLEYYIAGKPIVTGILSGYVKNDLRKLVPFVVLLLLVILFISFRNLYYAFIPLLAVLLSVIWTIGLMGYTGTPLSTIGVLIPVLLIAIGSAYGIHIITHAVEEGRESGKMDAEHIEKALVKVIAPLFMAAVTTMLGFLSLLTIRIVTIQQFGMFATYGVLVELVISVLLIPALLLLFAPQAQSGKKTVKIDRTTPKTDLTGRFLLQLMSFVLKGKKIIVIATGILVILMIAGAVQVVANFDNLKFFKKNSTIVNATEFIDREFSGSDAIALNIAGAENGDLTNPQVLIAMDGLDKYLTNKYALVGKVIGFHDMIKRMNEVMHYPEKGFNEIPLDPDRYGITDTDVNAYAKENNIEYIPQNSSQTEMIKNKILGRLISQYLILYSGNLSDIIAEDQLKPRMARMNVILKQSDSSTMKIIIDDIKLYVHDNFPDNYTVSMGGTTIITNELNSIVISGQVTSFLSALLIVFLLMSFFYKSFFAGLIGIIPISISILMNFAIMGYLGIELNIATALIASLSVGIGIDYTIHFLSSYLDAYKKYRDHTTALEATYLSSGKAIIYNAVSVGLGFAVLLFSSTGLITVFGLLLTIVMCTTSIGALILIPVIIEVSNPAFIRKW